MIRPATPDDAGSIALVHVRTWQAAYRGQLPDAYLDGLDATLDRRAAVWREAAATSDDRGRFEFTEPLLAEYVRRISSRS